MYASSFGDSATNAYTPMAANNASQKASEVVHEECVSDCSIVSGIGSLRIKASRWASGLVVS